MPNMCCVSDFQLDRLISGALGERVSSELRQKIVNCSACQQRVARFEQQKATFEPDPDLLHQLQSPCSRDSSSKWFNAFRKVLVERSGQRRGLTLALPILASLLIVAGLTRESRRAEQGVMRAATKGASTGIRVLIQRGSQQQIFSADDSQIRVYSGDRLQVLVDLPRSRFVAVYTRDAQGSVARYAPVGVSMVRMGPGRNLSLPNSTVMDGQPGAETLSVFVCDKSRRSDELQRYVLNPSKLSTRLEGCAVSMTTLFKSQD